jgi:flagellar biosynthetic protein FliR
VILTVASAPSVSGAINEYAIPLVLFDSPISIWIVVLREFLIGMALGMLAALPLRALQISGERIGTAMGFAMANTMDPMTQQQMSLIAQLQFMVGVWFYFSWNGHLLMIKAVVESLRFIPLAKMSFIPVNDMSIAEWLTNVLTLALRMTLPFYCTILLADIGLGFLARTVPQMNIFVLGLPLKVALGLFVLMAALPLTVELVFSRMEPWIEFAMASATAWR